MSQIFPAALQIGAYGFPISVQLSEIHFGGRFSGIQRIVDHSGQKHRFSILDRRCLHQVLGVYPVVFHLLVEGIPVGNIPAVRETYHQNWQTGLPEEHILCKLRVRPDIALGGHGPVAFPESVPVNKEIPVGGTVSVFQNVLKFPGQYGGVIQDEIQGQVHIHGPEIVQVLRRGKQTVQTIVDQGKAPVQVRVENAGQNIEGSKRILQLRPFQNGYNVPQRAANAVRVGVEHHAYGIPMGHIIPPFLPGTGHRSDFHRFWPE